MLHCRIVIHIYLILMGIACFGRVDCRKQQKAARGARVSSRKDLLIGKARIRIRQQTPSKCRELNI